MELQVFNSTEFGSVRTATVNGEVMFVGKDVADILGYQNGSRDINRVASSREMGIRKINSIAKRYRACPLHPSERGALVLLIDGVVFCDPTATV